MSKLEKSLLITIVLFAVIIGAQIGSQKKVPFVGSVSQGSEYQATTTSTGRFTSPATLCSSNGSLGSVTITGAAAGVINLYDATTSNINLRSSTMASTSILSASLPTSAAANTYVFDRVLVNGLVVEVTGTSPTSTISFRCN